MNPTPNTPRPGRKRGFTLIELMAATAIMSIIILAVVALSARILNVWTDSVGQLSAQAEARGALERLEREIEALTILTDGRPWLEVQHNDVGPSGSQVRMPTLYMIASTEERPRHSSSPPSDTNRIPGDTCAIAFTPEFDNPFTGNTTLGTPPPPIFALYRAVIDAENTFNGPLAMTAYTQAPTDGLSDYWAGSGETYNFEGGTESNLSAWRTSRDNFLSANIVGFSVVFWREYTDAGGATLVDPIDDNLGNGAIDDPSAVDFVVADGIYVGGPGGRIDGRVVFADITLSVISDEGMDRLEELQRQGNLTGEFNNVAREFGTTFTRRVHIVANFAQTLAAN